MWVGVQRPPLVKKEYLTSSHPGGHHPDDASWRRVCPRLGPGPNPQIPDPVFTRPVQMVGRFRRLANRRW